MNQPLYIRTIVSDWPGEPDTGTLSDRNGHERDKLVHFKQDTHEYSLLDSKTNTIVVLVQSMSSLSKPFFEDFDAEKNARSVFLKRKRDRQSPYYWFIQSQTYPDNETEVTRAITEVWAKLGHRASAEGTLAHLDMEIYLNGQLPRTKHTYPDDDESDLHVRKMSDAGRKWVDKLAFGEYGWEAYRTEHSIYIDMSRAGEDEDGDIIDNQPKFVAGQLDALFLDRTNTEYHLVDWKFCGKDKLDARSGEYNGLLRKGTGPLQMLPDNSLGKYIVQQSLYAFVLRRRYGITVKTARLIHVPSDVADPVAREIMLDLLHDDVIHELIKEYLIKHN